MTISAGRGISFAYLRTGQQHGQQQMAANSWLLLGESTSADSSARSRSFKASALLIPLPNYFQCRTGPSPQIRGKFPVVGHTSCQEALALCDRYIALRKRSFALPPIPGIGYSAILPSQKGIDGIALFDFPHRRHGRGDETGDIGHVAGHDNRVGRLGQVAKL